MNKDMLNNPLREYVRKHLSSTKPEQDFVASLYAAFKDVLGDECFVADSFTRFTAFRPVHDLDIIGK